MTDPKARHCPQCSARVDSETGLTSRGAPKPGDVSICLYCSGINLFTESAYGVTLRRATDAELDELLTDADVRRAIGAIGVMRKRGKIPPPGVRP